MSAPTSRSAGPQPGAPGATASRLLSLDPARMGTSLRTGRFAPKTRFIAFGIAAALTVLGLAQSQGLLAGPAGAAARPALTYFFFSGGAHPAAVTLALIQDPVGLVVLAVALSTPVFCSHQVQAIADFVPMNETNGGAAALDRNAVRELNQLTVRANSWFGVLGRRDVSAAIAALVSLGVFFLYQFVDNHGLLESWNFTGLTDRTWRAEVYGGWWANGEQHPLLAAALCLAGAYAFYFLTKQLSMGVLFAVYQTRAAKLDFGVTPRLDHNSDGYHGLRPLRRFMLWTYASALVHLTGLLALFVVWLPVAAWTFFVVAGVMVVDAIVIAYPSVLGYHSALRAKQRYAGNLFAAARAPSAPPEAGAAAQETIDRIWSTPVLPVRTRSTISGITLYLLWPAMVAVIPGLMNL